MYLRFIAYQFRDEYTFSNFKRGKGAAAQEHAASVMM